MEIRLTMGFGPGGFPRPALGAAYAAFGRLAVREARRAARAKGGRHFWGELADAVGVSEAGPDGVTVACRHYAAAQKEYGGEIRPKLAGSLTVPISPLSRRRRAGEFPQRLFAVKGADGRGVLGFKAADGSFTGLYALVKRVRQEPDPFWPSAGRFAELALEACRLALAAGGGES